MESFDILGLSPGFVSIIINVLIKIYNKDLKIRIVKNITCKDNAPYKIEGPLYEEIFHNEWVMDFRKIFIGTGKVKTKKTIFDFFYKNHSMDITRYCNIIHPVTDIAENVKTGFGNFLNYGVSVGPFSEIGNFITFNRHIGVGHHTKISDFCVLNPGVHIAGFCEIGENTAIGMGANIIDGIKIGRNSVIGAGSLVNKDMPDNIIAYGVPAKIIRANSSY